MPDQPEKSATSQPMRHMRLRFLLPLLLILLTSSWRISLDARTETSKSNDNVYARLWSITWCAEPARPLLDQAALYAADQGEPVVHEIYVTVLPQGYTGEQPDAAGGVAELSDFDAMNQITDYLAEKPELPAIFLDGDDPAQRAMIGEPPDGSRVNAVMTLRGHSTLRAVKKSYKIRLNNNAPPWQGQLTLNLNKHPNDESRIRNKVAFELFRGIPDLTSMQTCFVHLYVRDLSGGAQSAEYVDYGLFTHIEQAGRPFLKAHGLDEHGSLYKANYFEFLCNKSLADVKDPDYNEADFEQILEICAGNSHDKLLRMLADVNNEDLDIDQVLDRHFNRDNYFTWLAVNILLANYDTQTQNYFLYSPHDSLTWYFLPWDYDGSMVRREMTDPDGQPAQLIGVANYWNTKLHRRVFSRPANVEQLSRKVDEIYQMLNRDIISAVINRSAPLIETYYLENPAFCNEFPQAEFYDNLACMAGITELTYRLYYETLEKPMPIHLGRPEQHQGETTLYWTSSCDLQGDALTYDLQIAEDKTFSQVLLAKKGLRTTSYTVSLPQGDYFWRVVVRDEKGNSQRAFDIYWDEGAPRNIHTGIYGVAAFHVEGVKQDG